ncbi:MAG: diguanylate cyclase, partial [Deltaproteobacteria bacterium]|nr:diguanylate cyclase [Deltaproteobacteria bacterium]
KILSHTDQNEFGKRCTDEFCIKALRNDDLTTRTLRTGNGEILEVAHPISSGLRWGTLAVGFSLERINKIIFRSIVFNILFVVSFFIMGVVVLYFLLSKIVIRPIRSLSNESAGFMENVTGSSSIPLKKSKDEIENLGIAFGAMKSRIEAYTQRLESLVSERTAKLEEVMRKLEELAITDGLTGLYNHRYFKTVLDVEIRRFKRTGHKISLLMIDVDDFKVYNDRYGHVNGDACLAKIAGALKKSLRDTDIIARYGGEEFTIILFDTKKDDAISIAEKLRNEVASLEHTPDGTVERLKVTISAGVASFPADADNPGDLISRADEAMYRAKSSGKNKVIGY